MTIRVACVAFAAGWLAMACGALSQQPDQVLPAPDPGERLFPADQIELVRLIDLCAHRLALNIEYDAATLKGISVTLRLGAGIEDSELWALTNRLLISRGLTTVRIAGEVDTLAVVKLSDAPGLARIEPLEPSAVVSGQQAGFQAIQYRPRSRSAKELAEAIKPFLSKQGTTQVGTATIVELGNAAPGPGVGRDGVAATTSSSPGGPSSLIVADTAPRLTQIREMLGFLDTVAERIVVEEITLKHLGSAQMTAFATQVASKQALLAGPGRKPTGEILPSPNEGAILLLAPESQLPLWRELIAQLDQQETLQVTNYAPRFFGVKEVANLIDQTIRGGQGTLDPASGKVASGVGAAERLRIIIDDLTGTLIVTATPTQHERIAALLKRLDSVSPGARRPVKTFVLKNRPVHEVVAVIQDLLHVGALDGEIERQTGEQPGGDGLSPSSAPDRSRDLENQIRRDPPILGGGSAASIKPPTPPDPAHPRRRTPDGSSPFGLSSPSPQAGSSVLSLTADEQTNTLIAVGEPRALAQLETLLVTIDVRQPQVMLEVLLLSLTDTQTLALGLEFERLTKAGDAQIRLSSLFGLSVINAGSSTTVPGGAGGTVTVLSPGEFSILVRALETLNEGRSLSIPKLLVGNNQTGDFSSVLQQPVTTTVTPSSQVTTTTFGGYEQAGTTISVQPRIAEGDHLGLKYTVTLSAFTGTGSGGLPPPKQENTIKSDVIIPDAYTVALGGIDLATTGEGTSQIPFLGEIPIIGELFKNRNNNDSRTRFYVFIRAEVMRSTSFEDLKYASDQTTRDAGIDDGFPEMEPLLIR